MFHYVLWLVMNAWELTTHDKAPPARRKRVFFPLLNHACLFLPFGDNQGIPQGRLLQCECVVMCTSQVGKLAQVEQITHICVSYLLHSNSQSTCQICSSFNFRFSTTIFQHFHNFRGKEGGEAGGVRRCDDISKKTSRLWGGQQFNHSLN